MTDYNALNAQLQALTEGVPHPIANLANASFGLCRSMPWRGGVFAPGGAG